MRRPRWLASVRGAFTVRAAGLVLGGFLLAVMPLEAGDSAQGGDKARSGTAIVAPARGADKPSAKAKSEGTSAAQPGKTLSAEELYAKASPAVVTLTIENEDGQKIGSGSGFLVDPRNLSMDAKIVESDQHIAEADYRWLQKVLSSSDHRTGQAGYVLTNHHVIRGAVSARVRLSNGETVDVSSVRAESEQIDGCLLFVVVGSDRRLATLDLSDSLPPVGAAVYAIGSPGGDLTNSLSVGIISGHRKRDAGGVWLQTTAAIGPGSSGGPLLTADGRVVGITTAIRLEGQNLNFAVPIPEVRPLLKGPYNERPVWKGRSIREAERSAYVRLLGLQHRKEIEYERAKIPPDDRRWKELRNSPESLLGSTEE